ncbi:BofC C-terminal domain-containing protein [Cytobacillus horneckiae]
MGKIVNRCIHSILYLMGWLKVRTKRVSLIASVLIFMSTVVFYNSSDSLAAANMEKSDENDTNLNMNVILERVYLDGDVSQETVVETIWSFEDFWAKYDAWQLIDMNKEQVVFRRHMDDISPLLKANGYFGITDEGVLTIFNGRPNKANIIQSFFQIDLGKLESKKCEELKKGIPIMTKDRYIEVLQSFSDYSYVEEAS